jgi:hypothetical protein
MTGMTARGRVPRTPEEGAQTYIAMPRKTTRVAQSSWMDVLRKRGSCLGFKQHHILAGCGASFILVFPQIALASFDLLVS